MKINLNTLGLYLVLLNMMLVLIHQEVAKVFVLYRELFSLIFVALLLWQGFSKISHSLLNKKVVVEFFLLALFPLLIVSMGLVDPMVNLYGDPLSDAVSAYGGSVNPILYVFRNAVLYLPMVFYIAVRGLSTSDINKIAGVAVFFAPISIIVYMSQLSNLSTVDEFVRMISGTNQIEYNSFVPCFTISVLSAVYLIGIHFRKFKLLIKLSLAGVIVFTMFFIIYSTSRQALLLAIIYMVVFLDKSLFKNFLKNIFYFVLIIFVLFFSYEWVNPTIGENFRLTERLGEGLTQSPRTKMIIDGIGMLDITRFFTGAGLTSVLVSGPHNDYVRWIQRVGFILTFISFYPYLSAMIKSFVTCLYKKESVYLFIFGANLFIIYNSIFGYPREDAYQSLWCFLAIAMWFGHINFNRRKKIMDADKSNPLVN